MRDTIKRLLNKSNIVKKTVFLVILLASVMVSVPLFAQGTLASTTTSSDVGSGLTPSNPLYFLDKFIEKIEETLTFNQDAKVKLQIKFAKERVAEIKAMLNNSKADNEDIKEAQDRIKEHSKKAINILKEEKKAGKDIEDLEKELETSMEDDEEELQDLLEDVEFDLEEEKDILEQAIDQAEQEGDTAKAESLKVQIKKAELKAEEAKQKAEITKELLKDEELDEIENELDSINESEDIL